MKQFVTEEINLPRDDARRGVWLAWIVLAIGLTLTGLAALWSKSNLEKSAEREFALVCDEVRLKVSERMDAYRQILRSGAALFDASDEVTREEWRSFVARLRIDQHYPGIQGMGFALLIPRQRLAAHIRDIRSHGFPEYQVKPEGERDTYTSIIYLEPFAGRNLRAFGYDMFSEPVRRAAMERARDRDSATLSGKVILVQETGKDVQAGVLMYVPVYREGMPRATVEQRRAALQGWVYSPYRMNDLIHGMLGNWDLHEGKRIHLQVYDGETATADARLYDCEDTAGNNPAPAPHFVLQLPLEVAGHRWTLRFTQRGGLAPAAGYGRVWIILSAGTIISLLLAALFLFLLNARFVAQRMAGRLTGELKRKNEELTSAIEEIQASEELFCSFVENTIVGIYRTTPGGRVLMANPALVKMLGYDSFDELARRNLEQEGYRPDYERQEFKRLVEQGGQLIGYEAPWQRKDGSVIMARENARCVRGPDGEVLFYDGTVEDITERKRTEDALRTSEASYRRLFETAQDGILILNADTGRIEDANPFIKDQLGYPSEELLGKELWEIGAFKDIVASKDTFRDLRQKGYIRYEDLPLQTKDGRRKDVEFISNVYPVGDRFVVQCNIRDITERKRAEEEVRRGKQRMEMLVTSSTMMLYACKASGDFDATFISDNISAITGHTSEEFLSKGFWASQIHPEDAPTVFKDLAMLFEHNHHKHEYRFRFKDGAYHWMYDELKLVRDDSGNPLEILGTWSDITERKRAEQALRESEERYRVLFQKAGDAIIIMEAEGPDAGRIAAANQAAAAMHGYDMDEMARLRISDLDAPGEHGKMAQRMERILNGEWIACELLHRRKDGTEFPVECTAGLLEYGGRKYILAFDRDITGRKQAERLQSLSTEILDVLNQPLPLEEATNRILAAIQRETGFDAVGIRQQLGGDFPYAAAIGFSQDFLLTENSIAAHGPDGAICRDENGRACLECTCGLVVTGKTNPANPLFTPFGSFWINDSLPLLDVPAEQDPRYHPRNTCIHQGYRSLALIPIRVDQQIIGLLQLNNRRPDSFTPETIKFFEGISTSFGIAIKRKQVETLLQQGEEKYRSLVERINDVLYTLDERGCISYVSPQVAGIIGYAPEELEGRSIFDFVPPGDRDRMRAEFQRLLTEPATTVDIPLSAKGGSLRWVRASSAVNTGDGQRTMVQGVMADITSLKQAEREKGLAEERLRQAQKMEAIGQLAGGVAHDFNNMLAAIMGSAELLLLKTAGQPELSIQADRIIAGAEHAAALARQLLSFARKSAYHLEPVDVHKLAADTAEIAASTFDRQIAIVQRLEAEDHTVNGDASHLQNALLNLAINARDAMPGGGTLTIATESVSLDGEFAARHGGSLAPGPFLRLSLADTGCGMSEDVRQRIFEPFFTTKEAGKGTGLGLAAVYGTIKQHGGAIEVYSEPGRGAVFKLYLPLAG
ncbi:MAG: PAS domain S-box protein, partial [Candidatus Edwardsbacteria bacterium]|nr:PAS domain S-box protein [Candidatus Edwardsbacteria bacterium]